MKYFVKKGVLLPVVGLEKLRIIILDVYDKCMFIEVICSIELQNTDLCG